ncbi:hypothetical protein [Butyrivibrio proteoclasticus]|uniref:hypothetical protein n=1 Tax=Butyrivibrio proteoclasticus TaxID=43305 RepID=UPI0004790508|nr:hypothetical protein [Butyrivibrio proteoclasticus]
MITTGKELRWENLCRETAIIITNDGDIYEDLNHQYCLDSFAKDYFADMNFEEDLMDMIAITDNLFKNGKFHGFDLFIGDDVKILASHYKRAFEVDNVTMAAIKYANKNGCVIATFTNDDKLGGDLKEIIINQEEIKEKGAEESAPALFLCKKQGKNLRQLNSFTDKSIHYIFTYLICALLRYFAMFSCCYNFL